MRKLKACNTGSQGRLDSVEWNGGLDWTGMVEWNGT